jgi:undecaprenyl-diphosphatase
VGFLLADQIKALFSVEIVAWGFIIGGLIFLWLERVYKEDAHTITDIEQLSYRQAAWVGFAQMFALIPGTSRAGASIVGGMLVGLSRKASAEFSFLLALPVLAAASGYDFLKHYEDFAQSSFTPLIIGFLVSFLVAYLTMKLFLSFLDRFTFVAFGVYRILFGCILLLWFV